MIIGSIAQGWIGTFGVLDELRVPRGLPEMRSQSKGGLRKRSLAGVAEVLILFVGIIPRDQNVRQLGFRDLPWIGLRTIPETREEIQVIYACGIFGTVLRQLITTGILHAEHHPRGEGEGDVDRDESGYTNQLQGSLQRVVGAK